MHKTIGGTHLVPGLALLAILAALPGPGHAEIYKWVDAKGRTHYSDDKADARGARTTEVMVPPAADATPPPAPSSASPRTPGTSSLTPPSPTAKPAPSAPNARKVPPALSDGRDHGTDASRCALARDVLSGAVVHRNGKPTDTYDKQVAQNDVKTFCKER